MKKVYIIFLAIIGGFTSCDDRDDNIEGVNIRIRNLSSVTFQTVAINKSETTFELIESDSFSDYAEFEELNSHLDTLMITAGEDMIRVVPLDFTEDIELPQGLYTYEINLEENNQPTLVFRVD